MCYGTARPVGGCKRAPGAESCTPKTPHWTEFGSDSRRAGAKTWSRVKNQEMRGAQGDSVPTDSSLQGACRWTRQGPEPVGTPRSCRDPHPQQGLQGHYHGSRSTGHPGFGRFLQDQPSPARALVGTALARGRDRALVSKLAWAWGPGLWLQAGQPLTEDLRGV